MPAVEALHPHDIVVAAHLLEVPSATYALLASDLGMSPSTAHESVRRLVTSGLIRVDGASRPVNRRALLEFLEHGVRYAFPAGDLGPRKRGVPTAHSGPALGPLVAFDEPLVWPSDSGTAVGPSISPLLTKAADLPDRSPNTYALLTAIDALRVGRARERKLAMQFIRERVAASPASVAE